MKQIIGLAVVAVLLAGCELVTGVGEARFMGLIGFPDDLEIDVPATVRAGEDFTVTVRTLGADGCWRRDRTEVSVSGLVATVTPWDVDRRHRETACTLATVEITHTATVRFEQTGEGRVDIRGRDGTAERGVVVE